MSEDQENKALVLDSGRRICVDTHDPDRVNVVSPDGVFELAVRFTDEGPVLRLSAASLELNCSGELRLSCENLAITARDSFAIDAGKLDEHITGARTSSVGGPSELEAYAVGIRARLGDVTLHANDNVRAVGEKILLNS